LLGRELVPFPKLFSLAFILPLRDSLVSQNVFVETEKLTKNAEFSNTIGQFPIFYGCEWDTCMFGVFTAGFSGETI